MKTTTDNAERLAASAGSVTPKVRSKYGCCWACGHELPCTSAVSGVIQRTLCHHCGAWSNYAHRSELPGYRSQNTKLSNPEQSGANSDNSKALPPQVGSATCSQTKDER